MNERNSPGAEDHPTEATIDLADIDQLALLGSGDAHLRFLQDKLDGTITVRGEIMVLRGPQSQVAVMQDVIAGLIERTRLGHPIDRFTLAYLWTQAVEGRAPAEEPAEEGETILFATGSRRAVKAKTAGQRRYVDAIRNEDVVFAIGPAGTGKTYLAVVLAMDYLKRRLVDRVILVRPAVEAGEQLGYLPGDLQEKINPYLRPLYDALSDIIGPSKISRYLANGILEASPLAYMRGRTLNNAFVILDEAQNTTVGQMKMFLTRLGNQAKAVVTGDITQIDLNQDQKSGLVHVRQILAGTPGVAFVHLDGRDVMRHPLVRRIVDAFAEADGEADGRT